MKHNVVMAAMTLPGLTSSERLLLCYLADRGNTAGRAWPGRDLICAETGLHPKAVQRALRHLEQLGYLTREGPARPGRVLVVKLTPDRWPKVERPPRRSTARTP